jgi:hypothetical protein
MKIHTHSHSHTHAPESSAAVDDAKTIKVFRV